MKKSSSVPVKPGVHTSPERRRRRAPAEKLAMVEETYAPGHTVSYVARKHGINPSQLFNWRRAYEGGAMSGIEAEDKVVPAAEMKKLQERIRRLERLLGQKTEDVEILKETIRIAREKKLISRVPLVGMEDFQ